MAAERRRSASRDGAHDAPLSAAEVTFVSTAIGVAVPSNDVRHLQARVHVIRSGGRHDLQRLGLEDVRAFQVQLVAQGISWPALNQTVCALRFFYGVTLGLETIPERIAYDLASDRNND